MARKRSIDDDFKLRLTDSVRSAARKTVIGCLLRVEHFLALVTPPRAKSSAIHQLRVWTRRSVSAIDLYSELLPKKSRRWCKKLKKVRRAGNDARNLDVLADRLVNSTEEADRRWLEAIRADRDKSRRLIRETVEPIVSRALLKRWQEKIAHAIKRRRRAGATAGHALRSDWSKHRLEPIVQEYRRCLSRLARSESGLHQFRIRGKTLRYSLELLGSMTDEAPRLQMLKILRSIQERLGGVNDHATAIDDLKRRLEAARSEKSRAVWRTLIARERRLLRSSMRAFHSWMDASQQKKIDESLARLMDDSHSARVGKQRRHASNGADVNAKSTKGPKPASLAGAKKRSRTKASTGRGRPRQA